MITIVLICWMQQKHVLFPSYMKDAQEHLSETKAVDVTISDEGIDALREKLSGFEVESDDIMVSMISLQNTNEVAWEHYKAMQEISSMSLKNGNYDVEDLMRSIMDAYETVYNQIIKDHEENGDRQAFYKLTGKGLVTLEDDLAGLDEAFKWWLANLQGYITCQQTNKEYQDTVVTTYEPVKKRSDAYQGEEELEKEFIHILTE